MRRFLLPALVVALNLGMSARAADKDDAKEIVKKAIAAHGGAEKIEKYTAYKSTSKGTISILGMELEFTTESAFQAPDKLKNIIKLEIMGNAMTVEQKVVGDKSSLTVNGTSQEIPEAQKTEIKNALLLQHVMQLTPLLKDKGYTLKSLGESKLGDKDVVGVAVSGKDLKDMKMYFDKNTHLLAKVDRIGADPMGGGEVKQEMTLSEYKEFNGIKKPTKMLMTQDGKKFMESTTTEQKLLEKLDDKEFSD